MERTLYAQFDGDEVDGIAYRLGDPIKREKHDAGTLAYLEGTGRIAATRPATTFVIPADDGKPVEEMGRVELEAAAMASLAARLPAASDEQLRDAINAGRAAEQERLAAEREERDAQLGGGGANDAGDGLGAGGASGDNRQSTASYDDIKDKPLNTLRTAELVLIAEHENVSLDGANTNPDRVKAIEVKRKQG